MSSPGPPDQPRLTGVAQAAFEVNLLTEDNLPSYHHQLLASFGRDRAWRTWSHRWTAEEGRHAVVLRDICWSPATSTRLPWNADGWRPCSRVDARQDSVGPAGLCRLPGAGHPISHRNTGRYSDDPVADKIMVRVAADENLHMMFYRDIVAAALQVDPSAAVQAITEEVISFDMPGVGIQGFTRKALQMAQAGIYDLRIHHDEILWPLLRTGTCSASKAWTRRPSRRGIGSPPTWPRPTDSPTDSRHEPPPPPTNTARPAEQADQQPTATTSGAGVPGCTPGLDEPSARPGHGGAGRARCHPRQAAMCGPVSARRGSRQPAAEQPGHWPMHPGWRQPRLCLPSRDYAGKADFCRSSEGSVEATRRHAWGCWADRHPRATFLPGLLTGFASFGDREDTSACRSILPCWPRASRR